MRNGGKRSPPSGAAGLAKGDQLLGRTHLMAITITIIVLPVRDSSAKMKYEIEIYDDYEETPIV